MKTSLIECIARSGLKIICFFLVLSAIIYACLWPTSVSINAASFHLQHSSNVFYQTRTANDGMIIAFRASSMENKKLKTSVVKYDTDTISKEASPYTIKNSENDDMSIASKIAATKNKTQDIGVAEDYIDVALRSASMENKTLIIAILNKAYVGQNGLLELFLQSLREGDKTEDLIKHLLLVSVDELAFNHCKSLQLHCYQLVTEGVSLSKEVFYMSDDFIRMMWRRTQFLGDVLKRGYSFIFTDLDMLWLRNPFTKLDHDHDLQISCDNYNGSAASGFILINTGFYFVKANERTIALFDNWYAAKDNSAHMKDQDVLLKMKFEGVFEKMGMKVKYLETTHFSGFCQKSKDFTKVITMHANCCVTTAAKITDLRDCFQVWKIYNGTPNARWPEHKGCVLLRNSKAGS